MASSRTRSTSPSDRSSARLLGRLAEDLTATWLMTQGYKIVARQWRCRWGELDLAVITTPPATLVFVEVKARSSGSWDEGGKLAITAQKQAKLLRTAEFFLAEHPQWESYPCRFDVALVTSSRQPAPDVTPSASPERGRWVVVASQSPEGRSTGRWLMLQDYIPNAFEA